MAGENKRGRLTERTSARPRAHHGGGGMFSSDDSARMLLFGATALVVLIAAGFIAFGYYWSVVKPRGRTVLAVAESEVSYSEMKRRMAHEYYSNPSYQNQQSVYIVPAIAYQNLLEELTLIERAAEALAVSYTDEEFAAALRQKVGAGPDASEQEFGQRYQQALDQSKLNRSEFERLVRGELLEQKVKANLVPADTTAEQAKVDVIQTADEAAARAALERVRAGEDWATVAREVSEDPVVETDNGTKDYQVKGSLPAVYGDYAFTAPVGEISEPLVSGSGESAAYYIVRIADRAARPLTEAQRPTVENERYETWLTETQATLTIEDNWTEDEEAQVDALLPLLEDVADKERERLEQLNRPTPVPPTVEAAVPVGTPAAVTPAAETPAASTPAAEGAQTPVAPAPADGQ